MSRATLLLAIGLILFGFSTKCQSGLVITDIDGVANDSLYEWSEGNPADFLGIPSFIPIFWTITTPSANTLFFDTRIDVGTSIANILLSGLETNDDWVSASISGTRGVPELSYLGGDTAILNFAIARQSWLFGDSITITFAAVPEPGSATLLPYLLLLSRRRRRLGCNEKAVHPG